jgi:hypothetical protein
MNFLKIIVIICISFTNIYPQNSSGTFNIQSEKPLLKKHIDILGSDLFEGRGTGTKGGELAANYISSIYQSIDLIPIGRDSTYFQEIPLHGASSLKASELILYKDLDSIRLELGKDYLLQNSGEQTIIPAKTEMIFLGHGIVAPEYDHNDYLNNDVSGKIVVLLNGEPESSDPEYFEADEPTIYSYPDVKHRVAISRGAAGTVIIPAMDEQNEESWKRLKNEYSFEDVKLSYNASSRFGIIINPVIVQKYFQHLSSNSGISHNRVESPLNRCSLKFEGEFYIRDFKAYNVVGLLENSNSSNDEYVMVSAHYDHLGIGPSVNGDKIYNGVLDNAMGVSVLLEIARVLSEKKETLNRSIIFIATTGEEKGLLGSTYYVDHPIFPLYKTVANVNVDGVAFIDVFKSVIGIGASLSNLGELLRASSKEFGLEVVKIPKQFYKNEAFNRSDQIAFAKAGIPSILVLDAPDYVNTSEEEAIGKIIDFNENIYHTPFDDLNIKIDFNAVKLHTDLLSNFILRIASSEDQISWKPNVSFNYIRLQTIAEKR